MNNNYDKELKARDNTKLISDTTNNILNSGREIIRSSVQKKVDDINKQMGKIPQLYQNMKNNLTSQNNKEIKRMNENIANTGNHNAGGYAISKRFNNINEYNKNLSDIDSKKQAELSSLQSQIRDAEFEGDKQMAQLNKEVSEKQLGLMLDEGKRIDDYNLDVAKFNETKRVNDADILKIENDIELDRNEDLRKQEIHDIESLYLPKEKEQELINLGLKGDPTKAQIASTKAKTYSGSSSGSSSSKKDDPLSKMSAKNLSENIIKQIGYVTYDNYGNKKEKFSESKAYALLMGWKQKYNLPDDVVNDTAIYLGIQGYF